MANPAPVQLRLVSPQRGDDLLPVGAGARPRLLLNLTHRSSVFRHTPARPEGPRIGRSSPAMTGGRRPLELAPAADALRCWESRCASGAEVQMLARQPNLAEPNGRRTRLLGWLGGARERLGRR